MRWFAIFLCAYIFIGLALTGCVSRDGPPDDTPTTETGTAPTVPREVAVVDVSATQNGADVLFAFVTAAPVTRSLSATATWSTGDVGALDVGVVDGVALVALQIPAPCELLGSTETIAVRADGRTFDVSVELAGTVQEHLTVGTHTGLVASCRDEPVVLDAYPGVYELSSPGALLYGGGDYGQGYSAFSVRAVQYLGGRYELTWRAEPHYIMVRPVEL